MSLTSNLIDKKSPVFQFLSSQFSNHRAFLSAPRKEMRLAHTILPTNATSHPWATIGTALDYRLRYYFNVSPTEELIASKAATLIRMYAASVGGIPELPNSFDFFSNLDAFLLEVRPEGRRLFKTDEDKLNRYCYILALYDQLFRAGPTINSPLYGRPIEGAEELLTIPSSEAVNDMRVLSWKFYDDFQHLFSLPFVLNPTFEGSVKIGGADADLIVDGTLIDIKTTKKREIDRDWLWQIMGYVLLDYSDTYKITSIGLYLTRQGMLLKWDMREVLAFLYKGKPKSLEQLRDEFKEIVNSLPSSNSTADLTG